MKQLFTSSQERYKLGKVINIERLLLDPYEKYIIEFYEHFEIDKDYTHLNRLVTVVSEIKLIDWCIMEQDRLEWVMSKLYLSKESVYELRRSRDLNIRIIVASSLCPYPDILSYLSNDRMA